MIGNKQHSDVDEDIVLDFMEDEQTIDNNESEEGNFNDSLAGTNAIGVNGGFKKKLYAGIACLVLAVLVHLLFKSLIDGQVQQKYLADNMLNQIPMTTLYAEQALTNKGEIAAFTNSFSQLKNNMQALVSPTTMVSKVNGLLLSDSANKEEAFAQWSDYEQAANQYIALTKVLQSTKDKLASINVYLENASDETTLLVNSVAKEGRVKKKDVAKNKYLFLTSSSSNIISLINHLLVTTSGYYEPSTDKQKLATEQNILLLRIKEELARIIDNSAAVVATVAEPLKQELQKIDSLLVDISDSADSLNKSHTLVQKLSAQTPLLQTSLQSLVQPSLVSQILRALSYILPLSLLALAVWFLWSGSKSRPGTANNDSILTEALADQQESILKLLDEMSALADGDLTVEAEVTDRITGAIADSVNFAVIEMRDLVSQINRASVEVANESALAVENAQSVSQANMQQADQITLAAQGMQRITDTMRTMSQHAHQSSEMAQESTKVATQGAQAVRDTISGMEDMREQIQDTSKRIKRLGESSQRIGDIVALIDEIAEQTNILSLNAAIQASMAGEAGRGFAVVSDEVQGLAERSSEATKKIAALVAAIQNDTNDAMKSMEKATQQVVSGTRVADTAGDALAEIEAVSQKLSILIADISKSAGSQKRAVAKIADNVSVVSQSSTNTSRKAQDSANSIGKLLDLANELETSVSRFKLPTS